MNDQIAEEASTQISVMRNRALKGDDSIHSQQTAIIQSVIDQVRTETLAECRAATEQQICDLQDRAAHANDPHQIAAEAAKDFCDHYGGNRYRKELEKAFQTAIVKARNSGYSAGISIFSKPKT